MLYACSSSCDIKDKRDFNSKEAVKLLIQAVLDLGQLQTSGIRKGSKRK